MNAPTEFETAKHYSIPARFRSLVRPPRLLPGESQTDSVPIPMSVACADETARVPAATNATAVHPLVLENLSQTANRLDLMRFPTFGLARVFVTRTAIKSDAH
jgi:hypothetical protein